MSTPNTTAPAGQPNGQLFDLVQRDDGNWIVWTRKSQAELGLVDRSAVEAAFTLRGETLTDEAWAEYLKQPHLTEPSVWVIVGVYETRPTVDFVLNLLGVKRKPRPEGQPRRDNRQNPRRQSKSAAQAQAVA